MTKPNVRLLNTGIVHAHALNDWQITRCGVQYDVTSSYTKDSVDCMACLVGNELDNADIHVIITENSVKDIQEGVDAFMLQKLP